MVHVFRVPTAPGKTGPDLKKLENQGVWGQKPGKILQNLEKYFDLTLELQKCCSDIKNSFQAQVLRIKNFKYSDQNWLTGYFPIHNQQKWERSKFCFV